MSQSLCWHSQQTYVQHQWAKSSDQYHRKQSKTTVKEKEPQIQGWVYSTWLKKLLQCAAWTLTSVASQICIRRCLICQLTLIARIGGVHLSTVFVSAAGTSKQAETKAACLQQAVYCWKNICIGFQTAAQAAILIWELINSCRFADWQALTGMSDLLLALPYVIDLGCLSDLCTKHLQWRGNLLRSIRCHPKVQFFLVTVKSLGAAFTVLIVAPGQSQ